MKEYIWKGSKRKEKWWHWVLTHWIGDPKAKAIAYAENLVHFPDTFTHYYSFHNLKLDHVFNSSIISHFILKLNSRRRSIIYILDLIQLLLNKLNLIYTFNPYHILNYFYTHFKSFIISSVSIMSIYWLRNCFHFCWFNFEIVLINALSIFFTLDNQETNE